MTSTICLSHHHYRLMWFKRLRLNPHLCQRFTVALLSSMVTASLVNSAAASSPKPARETPSDLNVVPLSSGILNPNLTLPQSPDAAPSPDAFQVLPFALSTALNTDRAASVTPSSVFLAGDLRLAAVRLAEARLAEARLGAIARSRHETPAPNEAADPQRELVPGNQTGLAQRQIERSPLFVADAIAANALSADSGVPAPSENVLRQGSEVLGVPSVQLQGVFKQEGSDTSARARLRGFYPVTPNAGFGAEVDLTTGRGFADSQSTGLNLNELYFTGSLPSLPTLRFVVGLMDLTSYFDRNSFAKDGATHFFNAVFQTNPALAAAGIASRPGLLVNWDVTDNIDLKATMFSSSRSLGDFHLDAFAGEVGVRFGTAIIRGTYVSSRDAGQRSGFQEIFDIPRSGNTEPQSGDREEAYGINGEVYIPGLKLGLFGRYGRYTNLALNSSGTTYSAGLNVLDVFLKDDRLGLGYGRQLSNDDLRRARGDKNPDVLELFYDFRLTPNLRAAVTLEERNEFSETVVGFRVRTDFDISSLFRRSR